MILIIFFIDLIENYTNIDIGFDFYRYRFFQTLISTENLKAQKLFTIFYNKILKSQIKLSFNFYIYWRTKKRYWIIKFFCLLKFELNFYGDFKDCYVSAHRMCSGNFSAELPFVANILKWNMFTLFFFNFLKLKYFSMILIWALKLFLAMG